MREHTLYAITAQILTTGKEFSGSRQVPTFYLDSGTQGIRDTQHAIEIAKQVIDPMGTLYAKIHAEPVKLMVSVWAFFPASPGLVTARGWSDESSARTERK
jgi:hypothetical protein